MGNRSLFPGVAVPRAFFGTFFRAERKYCPPRGGRPTVRAGVGASIPSAERGMRQRAHQRAFRSPFGNLRAPKLARNPGNCNHCSCKKVFAFGSEQNDLPRGKPSAQPALPCTPLVVCLNSEPLTTYDGCIHRTRTFLPCPQKIPLLLFSKIRAKIIPLCG